MTPAREQWPSNGAYAAPPDPPRPVGSRRDTEDMLARVAKSETESNDVYRRIEEQLRQVARRLESAERNQSENNRAMSKAASEINVAAREQSQAFDQLGGSVTSLADRLERVERSTTNDGARDAIKGLHQGLSRLADQISTTANHSASQISALATNLEAMAGRLAQARHESEQIARTIDNRVGEIDHRIAQIDQRASHVSALDERLKAVERAAQASNEVLTQAVHGLEARKDEEAAALRRDAETAGALARLEDNVARLDARATDPAIDRRLSGIERSLADIVGRFEQPSAANDAMEDNIKRLAQRIEATETRHRDQVAELRAAVTGATSRVAAFEPVAPPPAAAPPSPFAPQPSFEAPPFPDMAPAGASPFQTTADPFATASGYDVAASPFAAEAAFGQENFPTDVFGAPPPPPVEPDNYLSAARRSARAAAAQADAERGGRVGGFSWSHAAAPVEKSASSKKTYIWIAIIALMAIVAIAAGAVLSQKLSGNATNSVSMLFPKTAAPARPTAAPLPAMTQPDATATPTAIKPSTSELKPLPVETVKPAPVHAAPVPATAPAVVAPPPVTKPAAALTPLDKLTQLATAGNAKAELVVGLKYLDGDGVTASEADAAKWLERAAEQGQPVAQYRLGTMYERGRGVAADPAKAMHWYELAAQAGNRKAMHNIAVAYAGGTNKNLAEAARWFSKAAALGLSDSQFNLAVLYERGMGVPQSLLDAYKWYSIAAAGGDTESKARMDALATQLSPDDKAAAQRAAASFRPQPIDPKANVAPQMSDVAGG